MPLILTTGAPTASGHAYDDIVGKQYEFPQRYKSMVTPGTPFVYYRGVRGATNSPPSYFGAGVTGAVRESSRTGRLIAEVHDVELFERPVPARHPGGNYLETGSTRGTNWANGVRNVSSETFAQILELRRTPSTQQDISAPGPQHMYASVEHARRLERYSVQVALTLLATEFGKHLVKEMPSGNPGYDIVVHALDQEVHVEVKGTVLPQPVFHLSEGQRRHSALLGDRFRLIVVYDVNVQENTHKTVAVRGPLAGHNVDLQPEAWTGQISTGIRVENGEGDGPHPP